MLRTLLIRNVALLERLELHFGPGLNVFTGETGAGKSILLDAFSLILGERADAGLIRAGQEVARVEGLFDVGGHAGVRAYLEASGIPVEDELVLARELSRESRNRCWINGSLTTLRTLRELGDLLVDLHGQHDHQELLREGTHLRLVDELGSKAHRARVAEVRGAIRELRELRTAQERAEEEARRRARDREHLEFQIAELEEAGLEEGEDEALTEELRLLSGAEDLQEGLGRAVALLDGDDEVPGALAALERAADAMERLCSKGAPVEALAERLREHAELVADTRGDVEAMADRVRLDPERLEQVEARLATLHRLGRKYGADVRSMVATLEELRERLDALAAGEDADGVRGRRVQELEEALRDLLPRLGRERAKLARRLASQVQGHLRDLAMPHATVEIELARQEGSGPHTLELGGTRYRLHERGLERARLIVGTNAGEPPGPLADIASGGELSRVMLGIKAALARLEVVPIMVFDEIDAGVGGETGVRMAEKLHLVSRQCQSLCVTHLPQVAAEADVHFQVEKDVVQGRTRVGVAPVTGAAREAELARMLGDAGSRTGKRHARHLLKGRAAGTGKKKAA